MSIYYQRSELENTEEVLPYHLSKIHITLLAFGDSLSDRAQNPYHFVVEVYTFLLVRFIFSRIQSLPNFGL